MNEISQSSSMGTQEISKALDMEYSNLNNRWTKGDWGVTSKAELKF